MLARGSNQEFKIPSGISAMEESQKTSYHQIIRKSRTLIYTERRVN
ncbi:hypothetical protein BDE02_13G063300 [Populus trichocarpa]|nr:hypothetical protein BDE02_13G063300 [Populus trichocarpa]